MKTARIVFRPGLWQLRAGAKGTGRVIAQIRVDEKDDGSVARAENRLFDAADTAMYEVVNDAEHVWAALDRDPDHWEWERRRERLEREKGHRP